MDRMIRESPLSLSLGFNLDLVRVSHDEGKALAKDILWNKFLFSADKTDQVVPGLLSDSDVFFRNAVEGLDDEETEELLGK